MLLMRATGTCMHCAISWKCTEHASGSRAEGSFLVTNLATPRWHPATKHCGFELGSCTIPYFWRSSSPSEGAATDVGAVAVPPTLAAVAL